MKKDWTSEEESLIVEMRDRGISYTDIASALQRTVNSIASRVKQLRRRGVNIIYCSCASTSLYRNPQNRGAFNSRHKDANTIYGRGCQLADIKSSECRWPVGNIEDKDLVFCAAPTEDGLTYCPQHRAVALRRN